MMLNTQPIGLMFKQHPRDPANVNAWKSMCDPYTGELLRRTYMYLQSTQSSMEGLECQLIIISIHWPYSAIGLDKQKFSA